jgi:aminocarboxymuconate-semialdehyde decarboxylase
MTYIDCDSHILPRDAFQDVDPEFSHRKPRIVNDTEGKSFVAYEERQRNVPEYSRRIPNPFMPRPPQKGDDPIVRVADMDQAQIDVQVLVPSNGSFYYDVEPRLAASVCRSYNNAIGRILKAYPGKFIGLATVPLQDANAAATELERAVKEQKLHAPVCYTSVQEKDLDDEELWPFYAKAEKLNVPIIVHPVNTGPLAGGWRLTRHYHTRGYGFWSALGNAIENSLVLANLMFGGVLDAFPKLRFCFMEGGATQVPHLLESLDVVYQGEGDYDRFLKFRPKQKPVEYLDRLYFTIRPTESLLGVLVERLGKGHWLIGTDYPHEDTMGSWPNTVPIIQGRTDLSQDAKDAILGGNALKLFAMPA